MPAADVPAVGVLDASVAVKVVVPETGTAESVSLLETTVHWLAPRLMILEVASALRRMVEAGRLDALAAAAALAATLDAVADGIIVLADDEALAPAALNLALTVNHKVPDCVYLALAEREGAFLASADRRLLGLARTRGIDVAVVPSA
ncbi:MAG: type II toxin-antitoxin system VapC family toxin [Vicinamibacterales bacterium]